MLTIALLWSWLHERNRVNHEERRATVEEFQYAIRFHVNEWNEFLNKKPVSQSSIHSSWKPPPSDFVKINIDGAFSEHNGYSGWGLICRDASHEVLFAAAGSSQSISNALVLYTLRQWPFALLLTGLFKWGWAEYILRLIV